MSLSVAICDDEKSDCLILGSLLHSCCSEKCLPIHMEMFSCGEDFLASHQKHAYDIVFMDIYMAGINGIEAVRNACRVSQCQTIFTTTSREHALEAISLNAAHYLVKPLTQNAVWEAMERCLARLERKPSKQLEIKTSQGKVPIPINSIVYIEVFNKICFIHTNKNTYQTYSTLDALFRLLDDISFMRAQRSFIINMNFIEALFFDHVVLKGGKEIMLSRNKRAKLKEQYQQFLFYLARRGEI